MRKQQELITKQVIAIIEDTYPKNMRGPSEASRQLGIATGENCPRQMFEEISDYEEEHVDCAHPWADCWDNQMVHLHEDGAKVVAEYNEDPIYL